MEGRQVHGAGRWGRIREGRIAMQEAAGEHGQEVANAQSHHKHMRNKARPRFHTTQIHTSAHKHTLSPRTGFQPQPPPTAMTLSCANTAALTSATVRGLGGRTRARVSSVSLCVYVCVCACVCGCHPVTSPKLMKATSRAHLTMRTVLLSHAYSDCSSDEQAGRQAYETRQ